MGETVRRLQPEPETIKRLLARSGNKCAFPGCDNPLFDDRDLLVSQCCHIEAAMPEGERFNEMQTNEERRAAPNLMFLCYPHHIETNNVVEYTVPILKQMKRTHEAQFSETPVLMKPSYADQVLASFNNLTAVATSTLSKVSDIQRQQDEVLERVHQIADTIDPPQISHIHQLLEEYKYEKANGTAVYKEAIEKIQHFSSSIDPITQDLPEKLTDGGFLDDVDWATELKETYAKRLLINDTSQTQQKIHALLLGRVQMAFRRHVLSAIREGRPRDMVRTLIDQRVVADALNQLGAENAMDLHDSDINGMVYFLTGNCHLRWL